MGKLEDLRQANAEKEAAEKAWYDRKAREHQEKEQREKRRREVLQESGLAAALDILQTDEKYHAKGLGDLPWYYHAGERFADKMGWIGQRDDGMSLGVSWSAPLEMNHQTGKYEWHNEVPHGHFVIRVQDDDSVSLTDSGDHQVAARVTKDEWSKDPKAIERAMDKVLEKPFPGGYYGPTDLSTSTRNDPGYIAPDHERPGPGSL